MQWIEELINQPFYNITEQNLLLVAYEEIFSKKLCSTCTSSYIEAYNQLKKHMAKKNQTQNQPQNQACKIKEEHINDTIYINGNEWRLGDLSEKQIEEHLLPYKGLIHLVDGIEN